MCLCIGWFAVIIIAFVQQTISTFFLGISNNLQFSRHLLSLMLFQTYTTDFLC